MEPIILRIDDIGASSKQFEQYGKLSVRLFGHEQSLPFMSVGFLKRLPKISGWGVYREMAAAEWQAIFDLLKKYDAHLTVCITAAWTEKDGSLTPFPEKFPEEAAMLKRGLQDGLIEIGNHGLTHCVVGKHLPRLLSSNRTFHREFWPWLPESTLQDHLEKSQKILTDYFGEIITFTPPGNQWTEQTEHFAKAVGIRILSASFPNRPKTGAVIWADRHQAVAFHDREIVKHGPKWLEDKLIELRAKGLRACSVKELYG